MKYLLVLILAVLLTACQSVPVARSFPQQPETTVERCKALELVPEGTTQLSVVTSVVAKNYGSANECIVKDQTWQEWYDTQKKIFESVK
jgi:hypothetical protein